MMLLKGGCHAKGLETCSITKVVTQKANTRPPPSDECGLPETQVPLKESTGDGEVDAGGSGVGQDKRSAVVACSGSTPGSPLVSRTACHFLDQS